MDQGEVVINLDLEILTVIREVKYMQRSFKEQNEKNDGFDKYIKQD